MGQPVPEDVCKVRLVFDLNPGGTSQDQAVMGWHMKLHHIPANNDPWPTLVQQVADKTLQKWKARITDTTNWSTTVKLARSEVYHLAAVDGKALDKGMAAAAGATAWAGTATAGSLPYEVACAVSLYGYTPGSFDPNGKFKRGRFYLPPFVKDFMGSGTEDGYFSTSRVGGVQPQILAFLNDVQGMKVGADDALPTASHMDLVIVSRARTLATQVATIRFGKRPDSQRRRQRDNPEQWIDGALVNH